jgi:hypothetical protein
MVELALVAPLFVMVLTGIIVLGMGIFYQQQITNAAREAARYAAIHSATSPRPTVSKLTPASPPQSYVAYDRPSESWPHMTAAGRSKVFGLNPADMKVAACWSGYQFTDPATGMPDPTKYDAPPPGDYVIAPGDPPVTYGPDDTVWVQCSIDGQDPTANPEGIGCVDGLWTTTVDKASNLSEGPGRIVANRVTAYTCYNWEPPLAGFLLIPAQVTLRGVITEPIERQQ